MEAEDGLKAQKLLAQGIALGFRINTRSRPERAKAFNFKAFALSGRLYFLPTLPRAMPWARSFCPFRAYWMWLMPPPLILSNKISIKTALGDFTIFGGFCPWRFHNFQGAANFLLTNQR